MEAVLKMFLRKPSSCPPETPSLSPRAYFFCRPERSEGSLGAYAPRDDKKGSVPRDDIPGRCPERSEEGRRPERPLLSSRTKRGMPRYRSAGQSRVPLFEQPQEACAAFPLLL